MSSEFLGAPSYEDNHPNLLRKILSVLSGIMQGKTNNTGSFTLTANDTTTTVTLPVGKLGPNTVILWQPTTANAATAMANLYVSARTISTKGAVNNTFTLTHSNTADSDKTFNYILVG